MLFTPKQEIVGTNGVTLGAFGIKEVKPTDGDICLKEQFVPRDTAAVQLLIGNYGATDTDVSVKILDGTKTVSTGNSTIVDQHELTVVPVSPPGSDINDAEVCISATTMVAIAGNPTGGEDNGQVYIGGKKPNKTIHIDYIGTDERTLISALPTIFERAALWAPGWVGAWTFWLFLVLLPLAACLACWQLVRLLRGDESPDSRKWLWLAIGIAFINAFAWSIFSPQFMGPDEVGHYAYAETLVQNHDIPSRDPNKGGYGAYGNHEALAVDTSIRGVLGNLQGKMPWDPNVYADWKAKDAALPDLGKKQGGGWTSAVGYSPFYYIGAAVPYELASGTTIWTQAWVMRLFSVILSLLSVWFCFLFARELLPSVPWAAPAAALVVAFEPMFVHIGGLINNDSMLIMFSSLLFYVLTRILRRGLTWRNAIAASAALALGLLAKPSMLAFFPLAAFVFGFAIVSGRGELALPSWVKRLLAAAAAAVVGLIILLPYYLTLGKNDSSLASSSTIGNGAGTDRFISFIWQWYLPRLPGMPFIESTRGWPAREVFLNGFLANFNSLDTYFGVRWYWPAAVVVLLLLGGAVAWGWRERAQLSRWWPQATLCVVAVTSLCLVINIRSWQQLLYDGGPFAQGRYLLPLVGVFGAFVVAGAQGFKRWGPALVGFTVAGLAVMNLFGYAISLTRFFY